MNFATPEDIKAIMGIFKKHHKIFPHIRSDKILFMIEKGNVIFDKGVVITFIKYKRTGKLGVLTDVICNKDSYQLHLIASETPGNGNAQVALNGFLTYIGDSCVTLSVRKDNERAIKFYEKNRFKYIGNIDWKRGEVKGAAYRR